VTRSRIVSNSLFTVKSGSGVRLDTVREKWLDDAKSYWKCEEVQRGAERCREVSKA